MSDHLTIYRSRQGGKTTRLIEEIINWLASNDGRVVVLDGAGARQGALQDAVNSLADTHAQRIESTGWMIGAHYGLVAIDNEDLLTEEALRYVISCAHLWSADVISTRSRL